MAKQAYLQQIIKKETTAGIMTDFLFSNGEKLGMGKFPPKFAREGEFYEYDTVQKGNYVNLAPGSFKSVPAPQGVSAPPAARAVSSTTPSGRTNDTQKVISRQAAANTAMAFLNLLATTDSLPIPKAKSDKKADLMEDLLKDYMNKFHQWSTHEPFDFGPEEAKSDLNLTDLEDPEVWNE